jgi:hypothetical protein
LVACPYGSQRRRTVGTVQMRSDENSAVSRQNPFIGASVLLSHRDEATMPRAEQRRFRTTALAGPTIERQNRNQETP